MLGQVSADPIVWYPTVQQHLQYQLILYNQPPRCGITEVRHTSSWHNPQFKYIYNRT